MRVLGLIPARGGSKGVPRKNLKQLCGKPLLQHTAEAALAAERLDRVVLSTDDEQIARLGEQCGLEVPFRRPSELAGDTAPTLPVVQHAVEWLERNGDTFDAVCLLQPTNPLRRSEHIDECIRMLDAEQLDTVMTILPVPAEHHPHWVYFQDEEGTLQLTTGERNPTPRRQALPPAFHREGSVYVVRTNVVMQEDSLYGARIRGYVMDPNSCVNIDRPEDFERAERLLSKCDSGATS